jgi:DNA-binding transcriptional MerR regulator
MEMHIGELARNAAVNVQTIRFYERQHLLPRPARSEAGYRCYEWSDLVRVGFTLAEIKQLLDLHEIMAATSRPPRRGSEEVQAIITIGRERLQTIKQKIQTLHKMQRNLVFVLHHLESANIATCPVTKSIPKAATKKS